MTFNLSVVHIIPDASCDAINQIAELYNCGPNNMSVKLQDSEGLNFWACHAFWRPEDYATFTDPDLRALVVPEELAPALELLYERLVLDGDAQENWQAALSELGLKNVDATF